VIYFSDLHMSPESEDTCFAVLDAVLAMQRETGHAVGFLGDFWHTRYQLPVYLLNRVREKLREFRNLYVLPGNHDQYDVNGRHALEVFDNLEGVDVLSHPAWDVATGCWLPYRKNADELVQWIKGHPRPDGYPDVAHLHHGIVGASMNNGMVAGEREGLHVRDLPFARVYCGHWHRHQEVAQCVFVGSQWQTRGDEAGQVKGVVVAGSPADVLRMWKPGHLTDVMWRFQPLHLGPAHHKLVAFTQAELAQVKPGDRVRVPAGTPEGWCRRSRPSARRSRGWLRNPPPRWRAWGRWRLRSGRRPRATWSCKSCRRA